MSSPYDPHTTYDPYPYEPHPPYDPYQQPPATPQQSSPELPRSYAPYQQPQNIGQQYNQPAPGIRPLYNQQPVVMHVPQQQYQPAPVVIISTQTNGKAIAALILGLLSWIIAANILTAIPGIILGHMALSEINNSGGMQSGRGMAITGLVLSYLSIAGIICICLYLVVFAGALGAAL